MTKSLFTDAHKAVVSVLVEARRDADIHQADLATLLGKDQSYISNIERGQRRVDLVEFYELAKAMSADPVALFTDIADRIAKIVE